VQISQHCSHSGLNFMQNGPCDPHERARHLKLPLMVVLLGACGNVDKLGKACIYWHANWLVHPLHGRVPFRGISEESKL
jgi:hypothetical protein